MYDGELDEEVEIWLDKYEEIFSEGLPLMQFSGGKEELIRVVKKCIEINRKYDTSWWDKHPDWNS